MSFRLSQERLLGGLMAGFPVVLVRAFLPADSPDVFIVERLFSSSLVVVVSMALPRRMNVYHFKKGTEICNYSYSHDILAVRLNRQVGSGQGSRW